jgi:predicted RNase H-like HicB family nuclease
LGKACCRRLSAGRIKQLPAINGENPVPQFLVLIEKAANNYSAYSPDLPGCVATADTREAAEANMQEAIQMHLDGLREDGLPIPEPSPGFQPR